MGIGPLISWRKSSTANLKKNFLFPLVISIVVSVVLLIVGMREFTAVLTYSICGFVTSTILIEYIRGIKVRSNRGENVLKALVNLVSRNKRRYGGYIIHLGIVVIVIGITSSSVFVTQKEVLLSKGDTFDLGRYELVFNGVQNFSNDAKDGTKAELTVYANGKKLTDMYPEKSIYKYEGNREINQETEVALRSTMRDDLYLILSNSDSDGRASIRALLNPMVSWIWFGSLILVFGAIITMWPKLRKEKSYSSAIDYSLIDEKIT